MNTYIKEYEEIIPLKKNILLTILFLITCFTNICAKNYEHSVEGFVVDYITGKGMSEITVTLMNADSVVLDTTKTISADDEIDGGRYHFMVRKTGTYIVKAVCPGYSDGYTTFQLRSNRENGVFVPIMRLIKAVWQLPDAKVTATKIKMVTKGDTIIYNADAFRLANGSMLDALISKLPGAKLTKDGQIYVNGKYIESLLVNGRDFFSGNPKIALENLPAYTVNKIKVYNKFGAQSELMGRDMGDKVYVMDVRLKKEYSMGYIENMEVGKGTKNRYKAKAFGLQFSNKSRTVVYANMNNLNDNQNADVGGNWWTPENMPTGLLSTKNVGLSYLYGDCTGKDSWASSENTFLHTDEDGRTRESSQLFLSGGDSFRKSQRIQTSRSTTWNSKNHALLVARNFFADNDLILYYTKKETTGSGFATISDSTSILNRLLTETSVNNSNFNLEFSQNGCKKIIADMLCWKVDISYDRFKSKDFSLYDLTYQNPLISRDFRNNYLDKLHQNFQMNAEINYGMGWQNRFINSGYNYTYKFSKTGNLLYRLDKLDGIDSSRYDLLPSTIQVLNDVMDKINSYDYHEYQNQHEFFISFGDNKWFGNGRCILKIPFWLSDNHLYYERMGRHDVTHQSVFFEPNLFMNYMGTHSYWSLTADMSSDIPDLVSMVNYSDDSDPLNVRKGNPNLKNIHNYEINAEMRMSGKHQQSISLQTNYRKTDNAVAYDLVFNKSTGVSTVKPVSVSGNWFVKEKIGYIRALDKKEKLILDNQLDFTYNHNIDMSSVAGQAESLRSVVNNSNLDNELKLDYNFSDNNNLGFHGGIKYDRINSGQMGFTVINAGDLNLGMNTQIELPWTFQVSTDLSLFARRGYQQSEMNTTDWIWNAQISRNFCKHHLLAKIQALDILHQLTNTQYVVNAQGRTESWHNSIPRYVMLSLSWQFSANPQKQ